jgi:hypothetical protein
MDLAPFPRQMELPMPLRRVLFAITHVLYGPNEFVMNWQWLLSHGIALCDEYKMRYGKVHTCFRTLMVAKEILPTGDATGRSGKGPTSFVFAGPDEFKYDTSIDIFTAYKRYIASKPWVCDNYLRIPDRKPEWV